MTFVRYFIYIVCGAFASSALGAFFACIVALVSPEFVSTLFGHVAHGSLVRYAAGVGMIWGLFLGTAVMAFSLGLVTVVQVARVIRKKNDQTSIV
jgi:ABC-type Co2+ transport system permease subunit